MAKRKELKFGDAFKYPFNRWKGMLNALWILLPIFGWFALGGYSIRISKEFVKGKFKELPLFNFVEDMKFGFFMFLKALPLVIVYIIVDSVLNVIPFVGWLVSLCLSLFVLPMLFLNFFVKETIESSFDFDVVRVVFDNFGDYVVAMLKSIGLAIVFFLLIIVLVGIPGSLFTKNIFIADFYGRRVK